ncbi:MAG: hypothetical protein WBY12_11875, partial [Hyphomicrobium sp.]
DLGSVAASCDDKAVSSGHVPRVSPSCAFDEKYTVSSSDPRKLLETNQHDRCRNNLPDLEQDRKSMQHCKRALVSSIRRSIDTEHEALSGSDRCDGDREKNGR